MYVVVISATVRVRSKWSHLSLAGVPEASLPVRGGAAKGTRPWLCLAGPPQVSSRKLCVLGRWLFSPSHCYKAGVLNEGFVWHWRSVVSWRDISAGPCVNTGLVPGRSLVGGRGEVPWAWGCICCWRITLWQSLPALLLFRLPWSVLTSAILAESGRWASSGVRRSVKSSTGKVSCDPRRPSRCRSSSQAFVLTKQEMANLSWHLFFHPLLLS